MFDKEEFLREEIKRLAILVKHSESQKEKDGYIDMVNGLILQASQSISFAFGDELEDIARSIAFEGNYEN